MRVLVTGGAGFVGSHLVEGLLKRGHAVTVYDDFSTGSLRFLEGLRGLRVVGGDMLNAGKLRGAVKGCGAAFHLAANADVRFGLDNPRKDLEQNTVATANLLEAMRGAGVKKIFFTSTGSVYGEPSRFPTREDAPFPAQTSLYAASKLAGEAMIQAYGHGLGFSGWIFRLVSVLGPRYSHGHVVDFYKQLRAHPGRLRILGDGRQRKSYVWVGDCVAALLKGLERPAAGVGVLNLGTKEECTVRESVSWICGELGLKPRLSFAGGRRGWPGDSPRILLDSSRLRKLGWKPTVGIREGVVRTLRYLIENPWALR